jgi:phosphoglycerol transferase MdoB-like AlkP superfamily enzyme
MVFFIFCRLIFLLYNFKLTFQLSGWEFLQTFWHGALLDISLTGYILLFSSLVLALLFNAGTKTIKIFFNTLTFILLTIFVIIGISDIELYRNWGYRMDGTVLFYLKTPGDAMASLKLWIIIVFIGLILLTIYVFSLFYKRLMLSIFEQKLEAKWWSVPLFLLISGASIIPVRGGVGIAPIRTGTVYFSQKPYANHAAVNVQWNFLNSLLYLNKGKTIDFMDQKQCDAIFQTMINNAADSTVQLINNQKPNILIIILESFSAKVVASVGGMPGVTPCFDSLAHEGILFTKCYANGDRSDKGIVSILSGYPAQPTTSIIKYTEKAAKLPNLNRELKKMGYQSAFYYGGDLNFANMKSYFISGGYQKLITKDDFNASELNSKWGAHDHVVFNRLLTGLDHEKAPFFYSFFTLSSHEPFDVPMKSEFNGDTEESKYLNSIHYTDSCLGSFIRKAKQTPWWSNTLVILVADHGSRFPGNSSVNELKKFHIPMVWIGGALIAKDKVVDRLVNQCDIATMLCHQMNIPATSFKFGKDAFSNAHSFANYAFNNGFGHLNGDEYVIWDNASSKIIDESVPFADSTLIKGKAFLQKVLDDFNHK